jgi:sensor histidine kinase YesM
MGTIVQRLKRPWFRAVTTGVMGAVIVTGIFILAGGRVSERFLLVALIYSGTIAGASALVLPWVERAETRLTPIVQRLVVAVTFIGIAALGALAAGGVVLATGLVPAERSWYVMTSGLGIALLVAVLLFTHEMGRERRARAEQALREEAERRQQAERLAKEARLASLESRLQPHFLRNALNTISQHITADPLMAEDLLEQLASLLDASLERTTRRTIPLREEIKMVWDFLDIERAQLGDRLRWTLQSLRDVHGCEVPPFSLQSLVHNSVKHVAARRPEGAAIRVEGGLRDGQLVLSVWDDGPGFDLSSTPRGHGLDTLRLQLDTLYGQRAGLEVRREDAGTRVVMWLPASESVRGLS